MLKPVQHDSKYRAFTLSEVLIALITIAVIAMLVIPSMVKKYHHKAYEIGFKKAWAMTNNAVQMASMEKGSYNLALTGNNPYTQEINLLYKYFGIDTQNTPNINATYYYYQSPYYDKNNNKKIKNIPVYRYDNDTHGHACCEINTTMYNIDGMLIGVVRGSAKQIHICIDTNGISTPNRLGYDIWKFTITTNNFGNLPEIFGLLPLHCTWNYACIPNPQSCKSAGYGQTQHCGYYALTNQNPDNPDQSYWDGLE